MLRPPQNDQPAFGTHFRLASNQRGPCAWASSSKSFRVPRPMLQLAHPSSCTIVLLRPCPLLRDKQLVLSPTTRKAPQVSPHLPPQLCPSTCLQRRNARCLPKLPTKHAHTPAHHAINSQSTKHYIKRPFPSACLITKPWHVTVRPGSTQPKLPSSPSTLQGMQRPYGASPDVFCTMYETDPTPCK